MSAAALLASFLLAAPGGADLLRQDEVDGAAGCEESPQPRPEIGSIDWWRELFEVLVTTPLPNGAYQVTSRTSGSPADRGQWQAGIEHLSALLTVDSSSRANASHADEETVRRAESILAGIEAFIAPGPRVGSRLVWVSWPHWFLQNEFLSTDGFEVPLISKSGRTERGCWSAMGLTGEQLAWTLARCPVRSDSALSGSLDSVGRFAGLALELLGGSTGRSPAGSARFGSRLDADLPAELAAFLPAGWRAIGREATLELRSPRGRPRLATASVTFTELRGDPFARYSMTVDVDSKRPTTVTRRVSHPGFPATGYNLEYVIRPAVGPEAIAARAIGPLDGEIVTDRRFGLPLTYVAGPHGEFPSDEELKGRLDAVLLSEAAWRSTLQANAGDERVASASTGMDSEPIRIRTSLDGGAALHDLGTMRLGQHRAVVWSVTNPFERTVGFDRVETSCTCSAGNLAVTELAPGATLQLELRQEAADPRGGTVSVRLIGSRGEQAHTLFLRYSIASEVPTPFVAKYLGSHLTSETIEVRLALPLPAAPDLAFARIAEADAPIAVPVSGTLTGTLVVSGVSGSSLLLEGDVRPLPDHAGALSGRYALSFMEAEYAGILLVDAVPLDATRPSGGLQAARGPVPTRVWPSPRHAFAQGAPESRLLLGFSGHRPNGLVLGDGRASNHVNVAGRNGTFGIRLRQDGFVEIDYAPSSTGSGVSGAPVEFAVLTEMLLYHVSLVEHSPDLGGPLD